jgi:ribonuclease D
VRERAALAALVERIGATERVALDSEADSLHHYFEKICLIQLSLDGAHYLVDPLSGLELGPLTEALADKPLILHGGDYDLRLMRSSLGFKPRAEVFDTMIAAQLLGFEHLGLAALVKRYFGFALGKAGQKSDWSRRPLGELQLSYAVNDTRFLEAMADRLAEELERLGRLSWHRQSCQAMVVSTARERARDAESEWRISGAGRLTRRELAYLRELWSWRDRHARSVDLPAFKILGNQDLLNLALWAASHPGAPTAEGPKLPRNIVGARLMTLESAITRAAQMGPTEWPEQRRGEREVLSSADQELIKALRVECVRIAGELQIAPPTLAPRAALEAIARTRARGIDAIMASSGLLRWQAELVCSAVESVSAQNSRGIRS